MSITNISFSNDEKIDSKFCKTPEEAITKESFFKGILLCLKYMKEVNYDYFTSIISKLQKGEPISIEEYNKLEKIFNDEDFIRLSKKVFNQAIIFSGTLDEREKFALDENYLRRFFLKHIFTSIIKNRTQTILSKEAGNRVAANYGEVIEGDDNNIGSKSNFVVYRANIKDLEDKGDGFYVLKKDNGETEEYDEVKNFFHKNKKFIFLRKDNSHTFIDDNGEEYGSVSMNYDFICINYEGEYLLFDRQNYSARPILVSKKEIHIPDLFSRDNLPYYYSFGFKRTITRKGFNKKRNA